MQCDTEMIIFVPPADIIIIKPHQVTVSTKLMNNYDKHNFLLFPFGILLLLNSDRNSTHSWLSLIPVCSGLRSV